VSEVDLVGVEGEDLALRVAPLELDGDEPFLHLALETLEARAHEDAVAHVLAQEHVARELLGDGAGATAAAEPSVRSRVQHVAEAGHDDARDAQAEMLFELGVFLGDDGLPEPRGHVLVADDDAAFGRELGHGTAIRRQQTRDRVRLVVVERRDLRQIVAVGEQHAAEAAEAGGEHEQSGNHRPARNAHDHARGAPASGRAGPGFLGIHDASSVRAGDPLGRANM
jgi:hypothetical protein